MYFLGKNNSEFILNDKSCIDEVMKYCYIYFLSKNKGAVPSNNCCGRCSFLIKYRLNK